jgi:hypothetical protein
MLAVRMNLVEVSVSVPMFNVVNGKLSHVNLPNVGDAARQNTVERSARVGPGVKDIGFGVVLRRRRVRRVRANHREGRSPHKAMLHKL